MCIGSIEPQQEPIVEDARIVDAIWIDHDGVHQAAEFDEMMPVSTVAGQPRRIEAQHCADISGANRSDKPLEAWAVGTPVIYPQALKAQAGDAAVLFDYDSPRSLANAIVSLDSADVRARLRRAGMDRLQYFAQQTEIGHRQFALHMDRLKHRLGAGTLMAIAPAKSSG